MSFLTKLWSCTRKTTEDIVDEHINRIVNEVLLDVKQEIEKLRQDLNKVPPKTESKQNEPDKQNV